MNDVSSYEFLDRLANPERYEILDFAHRFGLIAARKTYGGTMLQHWELNPGVHRIKLSGPKRSSTYSFITTIRNKFYGFGGDSNYNAVEIEMIETGDLIWFTIDIIEKNHIVIPN